MYPNSSTATSTATWQLWLTAAEVIAQAKQQWQQNGWQGWGKEKGEGKPTAIAVVDVVGQDKFLRFQ